MDGRILGVENGNDPTRPAESRGSGGIDSQHGEDRSTTTGGAVMTRGIRTGLVAAAAAVLLVWAALPALAATIADWEMNEGSTASTMVDSSGNGINGSIGDDVVTNYKVNGATAYHWTYVRPNAPPANPERLVTVSSSQLNPGTSTYSVTVRFRTTVNFGNIIQKGQSHTAGGYFKWQIPSGKLSCLFRGIVNGNVVSKSVNSGTKLLNDGAWHTVTCTRTSTGVTMVIDGNTTRRATGTTGSISNSKPLTIGGKLECDQQTVTCDYFVGDIDYVKITKG
jgi:hypothetical protein